MVHLHMTFQFQMWGWAHILSILLPAILVVIFHFSMRKKSFQTKRKFGIILCCIMIAILIARNIKVFTVLGFSSQLIPFQVCHLANFILLFAFIFNNKLLFALAFCFFLPAAIAATLFADALYAYSTIFDLRAQVHIWGHALIVSSIIWALLNGFIMIKFKTALLTVGIVAGIYFFLLVFGNVLMVLGTDQVWYFYVILPEPGTPLEMFFNWGTQYNWGWFYINPIYMLFKFFLAITVIFTFYGIFLLLMKFTPVKNSIEPAK